MLSPELPGFFTSIDEGSNYPGIIGRMMSRRKAISLIASAGFSAVFPN